MIEMGESVSEGNRSKTELKSKQDCSYQGEALIVQTAF